MAGPLLSAPGITACSPPVMRVSAQSLPTGSGNVDNFSHAVWYVAHHEKPSGTHVRALGMLFLHSAPISGSTGLRARRTLSFRLTYRHVAMGPGGQTAPALNVGPGAVMASAHCGCASFLQGEGSKA